MALAGYVSGDFDAVCQAHTGYLPKRGVRLLRRLGPHVGADAALLGVARAAGHAVLQRVEAETQGRSLRLAGEGLASLSYELVCGWHYVPLWTLLGASRAPYANKKPKVLVLASENRVFRPRKLTHDRRAVRQMVRIAVLWSDVKWGGRDAYLVTTAARTSTADRRRPRRGL